MSAAKTINFDELKKAVTPEITRRILQHFKVDEHFTAESDGSLRGPCPFRCEKATGRSFKITADGKAWFNHDRACQCLPVNEDTGQAVRGGNMLDFIRFKTGGSIRDAGLLLDTLLQPSKAGEGRARPAKAEAPAKASAPETHISTRNQTFAERGLKPIDLDHEHEAIISLGLEPETVAALGAGVSNKGMMRSRLAFPIHNASGELVAYTGFKLDKTAEGPLWLLPKDFNPGLELIGLHRLKARLEDVAIVVLTFDMLETAYALQAFSADHGVLTILSTEISAEQKREFSALVESHGFAGSFLVLAAPSNKSGSNPAIIDQAVLHLARLAPTKCVVLPL